MNMLMIQSFIQSSYILFMFSGPVLCQLPSPLQVNCLILSVVVFVVAVFNVKYLFQFNERNCELEKNVKNVKETELEHAWTPEPVKDTALRKMHGGLKK